MLQMHGGTDKPVSIESRIPDGPESLRDALLHMLHPNPEPHASRGWCFSILQLVLSGASQGHRQLSGTGRESNVCPASGLPCSDPLLQSFQLTYVCPTF